MVWKYPAKKQQKKKRKDPKKENVAVEKKNRL